MFLQERDRLIFFILINSVIVNLFNSCGDNILHILCCFVNIFILILKIFTINTKVRKYKWIISCSLFIILFIGNIFDNNNYISNDKYYQKKEIISFINIEAYNEIYNETLFVKAKMNKPNKFMRLEKGDNIYLLKRFNLKENNKYKITFLLNDVYVKNNSIYIDNYSILEKTPQSNRMHSKNSRIQKFFEREYNNFCWSMVTGDSSVLNDNQKEYFRRTGTAHLFAVSGLHMGFVFLFSKLFLGFFNNRILSSLLSLSMCFYYGIFVGFPDSTVRAFMMVFIYEFSKLSKTKTKIIYIFCIVFAMVLLLKGSLLSIGLQLSFTIVLFILFALKENRYEDYKFCFRKKVFSFFIICISASCGSFFLVLDNFGHVSFFSCFVNFFVNPIVLIIFLISIVNIIMFFYFESIFIFDAMEFLYSKLFSLIKIFYELEICIFNERIIFDIPEFLHLLIFFFILWLHFLFPPKRFRVRFISSFFLITLITGVLLIM